MQVAGRHEDQPLMDFGALLDGNNLSLIFVCAGLCIVTIVILTVLNFIGGFLSLFLGLAEPLLELLAGGPIAWMGCLFMLFACGGCGLIMWLIVSGLQSCGTPQAINLCRLFGS